MNIFVSFEIKFTFNKSYWQHNLKSPGNLNTKSRLEFSPPATVGWDKTKFQSNEQPKT